MTAPPPWVEHALLWHVYPLGFLGAPAVRDPSEPPVPRLRGLVPWLDHLVRLGANALLLGPVFRSETHGYDTTDHFTVDPRLGTEADLAHLVEQAHARGVRVVLDGVFNHVGRSFGPLADVLERGAGSAYASWFRRGRDGALATFEGHAQLVAFDHGSPAVADHVVAVMDHWSARGVDGWRLDAAYAVPTRFWAQVSERVRSTHPDAYVFGEVLHGDYAAVVREAGFDAVTQYELWKSIWSSLNDGNFFELSWTLSRHVALLDDFVPLTFVGNHDVTRIASRLTDRRHLAHAVALLLTLAGTPTVYAGDELGMTGVKEDRAGGDDAVRPVFPPTPAALAPGGPAALTPEGRAVLDRHRELIALRRRHPWLHTARTDVLTCTNRTLVLRQHDGDRSLLLALSVEDGPTTLPAPGAASVLAGDGRLGGAGDGSAVDLPPHGWAVLGA